VQTNERPGLQLTPQTIFGSLIILWGLILIAGNLGWTEAREVFSFWPLVLTGLGVAMLSRASEGPSRLVAGCVLGAGLILTVGRLFGFHPGLDDLWPLFLVALGLSLVMRAYPRQSEGTASLEQPVSAFVFWSGTKRRVTSQMFRRADFSVVMGGVEVDLRAAGTAGGEAVIDVFVVMGGMEILVAPDWTVSNHIVGVMSSVDDKSTGEPAARNRLVLRGFVMMGSVEIKS